MKEERAAKSLDNSTFPLHEAFYAVRVDPASCPTADTCCDLLRCRPGWYLFFSLSPTKYCAYRTSKPLMHFCASRELIYDDRQIVSNEEDDSVPSGSVLGSPHNLFIINVIKKDKTMTKRVNLQQKGGALYTLEQPKVQCYETQSKPSYY